MFDEVDALLHEDELEVAGLGEPLSEQLAVHAIDDLDVADVEMRDVSDDFADITSADLPSDDAYVPDDASSAGQADDDDGEQPVDAILLAHLHTHGAGEREPREHLEDNVVVMPRRDGEFVCRICFLLRPRWQLADDHMLICRDCA